MLPHVYNVHIHSYFFVNYQHIGHPNKYKYGISKSERVIYVNIFMYSYHKSRRLTQICIHYNTK